MRGSPSVRSVIRKLGIAGSRGAARNASASSSAIGPGRRRQVAHHLLVGNGARQRGGVLGPAGSQQQSLGTGEHDHFLLLSSRPLGPLCFSFGRRFGPSK